MTYFAYARTALKFGLLQLGLKRGNIILLPEYICNVVLHPILDLGLKHVYYSVQENFEPEWSNLQELAEKSGSSAILMVHYFGQPQKIEKFRKIANENNLFLVEDNAHGYGGHLAGKKLGTFGDIGISSPRKILNISSGGMLYIDGTQVDAIKLKLNKKSLFVNFIKVIFRRFPRIKVITYWATGRLPDLGRISFKSEPIAEDRAADNYSTKVINNIEINNCLFKIAESRRERWKKWEAFALKKGWTPSIKGVHPESSPWAIPIYIESSVERKKFQQTLLRFGVMIYSWPDLPKDQLINTRLLERKFNGLVCIPLDSNFPESSVIN